MNGSIQRHKVVVQPRRVAQVMLGTLIVLLLAHVLALYVETVVGHDRFTGSGMFVRKFDMNRENSIPTWYGASALLTCGAMAALISRLRSRQEHRRHWAGLAVLLVFLSLDEASWLHEEFSAPVTQVTGVSPGPSEGVQWAWVLPYVSLAAVFAIAYIPFLRRLPGHTRTLLLLAGVLYVGGAAGLELLSPELWTAGGTGVAFLAVATLEEVFEILGITVLTYALTTYLRDHAEPVTLAFSEAAAGQHRPP